MTDFTAKIKAIEVEIQANVHTLKTMQANYTKSVTSIQTKILQLQGKIQAYKELTLEPTEI